MPDVIVIGSGAGGMAAAVALARAGQNVLVIEQHDVPGGWCHSFRLGGHQFSPGVHYLGELGPGGRLRRIYEGLGVANDLTFLELNPEGIEHVRIAEGDFSIDLPRGREAMVARLSERFPSEARGIEGYLAAVGRLSEEIPRASRGNPLTLPFRAPTLARYGLLSAGHMARSFVSDPRLRAALLIQAGDHGLGPDRVPAAVHASVQAHYFNGGWYPKGGGAAIPRSFLKALRAHGGVLTLKTRVERILVEREGSRRIARGVRLMDGTEIRARHVISNADPGVTYGRLLAADARTPAEDRRLARTRWSISCISLFAAVDDDLRARGLDSGNYWIASDANLQAAYDRAEEGLDMGIPRAQFLTVTTLKDPSKGDGRTHTIESFAFVRHEAFKRWAASRFGERPEDYAALKESLTAGMLAGLERVVPGISARVTFKELGTPLTNDHYCMATEGSLYGTEKSLRNIGPFAWPVRTGIEGLTMCGASTIAHGIMGATQSGLHAAASVLDCRPNELLTATNQSLTVLPADDLSAWPAALTDRLALRRPGMATEEQADPLGTAS